MPLFVQALRRSNAAGALYLLDLVQDEISICGAAECLVLAACQGFDHVVDKLIANGHCEAFKNRFVWSRCKPMGNKVLQWDELFMEELEFPGQKHLVHICASAASTYGDLDTLAWLYRTRNIRPDQRLLDQIKDQARLLKIYKWMTGVGLGVDAINVMDHAAANGSLDVLVWLHNHSDLSCTTRAMDSAASNGHLDVVQWLHSNRTEGCTDEAMVGAAAAGHFEVVQWLHEHAGGDLKLAALKAAQHGHVDMLARLYDRLSEQCARCLEEAMLSCIATTTLDVSRPTSIDVLRWIAAQRPAICSDCEAIERSGQRLARTGRMVLVAEFHGDLEVLEYLLRHHRARLHFADPNKAIRRVTQSGHLAILQWVVENFGDDWHEDWEEAIEAAEQFGHGHILAWIEQYRSQRM